MNLGEAIEAIDNISQELIGEMTVTGAEDLGLDPRSCYGNLYISEEGVAIKNRYDRSLQYYGGFEYVDEEYRYEIGEYVFYSSDASRVRDCIQSYSGGREVTNQSRQHNE